MSSAEHFINYSASNPSYTAIPSSTVDLYQSEIEAVYADDPELWRRVLGDELWFQFGIYPDRETGDISLSSAGRAYFQRQLELAGVHDSVDPPARVLDVGCGWGAVVDYLAKLWPTSRIDAINVSGRQLTYCNSRMRSQSGNVHLYLCNACDIAALPLPQLPYDFVVLRGSITHFTYDVLGQALAGLAERTRAGATVVVSENLYNGNLVDYRSFIPDAVDRLACGYRKTLQFLTQEFDRNGFEPHDVRVLPSNQESSRWLRDVISRIDSNFPEELPPRPLVDLRDHARNWIPALESDKVSVYSLILKRR